MEVIEEFVDLVDCVLLSFMGDEVEVFCWVDEIFEVLVWVFDVEVES